MQRHLPATELERDGGACAFNDLASHCPEQRLDTQPLNVSIDGLGKQLLQGLSMGTVHGSNASTLADFCNHFGGGPTTLAAAKPNHS
jgi:hypothetical protein